MVRLSQMSRAGFYRRRAASPPTRFWIAAVAIVYHIFDAADIDALAAQLQEEGAKSFVQSWNDLMTVITAKSAALKQAAAQ